MKQALSGLYGDGGLLPVQAFLGKCGNFFIAIYFTQFSFD